MSSDINKKDKEDSLSQLSRPKKKPFNSSTLDNTSDESQQSILSIVKSKSAHDIIKQASRNKSNESPVSSSFASTINIDMVNKSQQELEDKLIDATNKRKSDRPLLEQMRSERFSRSSSQHNDSSISQASSSSQYYSMNNSSTLSDLQNELMISDNQAELSSLSRKQRSSSLSQACKNDNNSTGLSCIDLSQYKPVEFHWFYCGKKEVDQVLLPFSFLDSKKLEDAYGQLLDDRSKESEESTTNNNVNNNNNNLVKKSPEKYIVSTDGGRYDVDLIKFTREAVYWRDEESVVKRCSWFYKKDGFSRYEPYDEEMCITLEKYYKACAISNDWNKRYSLSAKELLIINGPTHFVHYDQCCKEEWLSMAENPYSPRQIHRGANEIFNIEIGEPAHDQIDHLIFFIHGVGGVCDVRFRSCVEVVNDFRKIANNLLASSSGGTILNNGGSKKSSSSSSTSKLVSPRTSTGQVRRIEFLPISWHSCTRREIGINDRLNQIALSSVPKLRQFLNKVIVDALLYSSGPIYCQTIMDNVGNEVNRLYTLFCKRHPSFDGSVSLAGHSLGSLIVFDLLANQVDPDHHGINTPSKYKDFDTIEELFKDLELIEYLQIFYREKIDIKTLILLSDLDLKEMKLPLGVRRKLSTYINFKKMSMIPQLQQSNSATVSSSGATKVSMGSIENMNTGQWMINYPQLKFKPRCFFAFGSPTPMFLTARGMENFNSEYKLPTCNKMLNIFHPYDPIAYRMEPLIDTRFAYIKPVLIPHHRGGKRIHLQLRDGFAKVGSDLKHKIMGSLKSTWSNLSDLTRFSSVPVAVEPQNVIGEEMIDMSTKNNTQEQLVAQNSEDKSKCHQVGHSKQGEKSGGSRTIKKSLSDTSMDPLISGDTIEEENLTKNPGDTDDDDEVFKQGKKEFDEKKDYNDDIPKNMGKLNEGRRVDFVLQEKPIEYMFNEYVFAFTSHANYWQNEDSAMIMLNEIYQADDIQMFDYFDEPSKSTTD